MKSIILARMGIHGGISITNRITTYIAANEGKRAQALAKAVMEDPRFDPLEVNAEIPLDVQFGITEWDIHTAPPGFIGCALGDSHEKIFNAEFKEVADYVTSALSPTGHLFMQILAAREAGHSCIVVVLGGDNQVTDAIQSSLWKRYKGKELAFQIGSYEERLRDFEAQCFAIGVPVMRWNASPYKRLLSVAHKVLTGGNLMGYRPRPADGERELTAASCLFKNIGPALMSTLLEDYSLKFCPKKGARAVEDLPGFGPKRAAMIRDKIASNG